MPALSINPNNWSNKNENVQLEISGRSLTVINKTSASQQLKGSPLQFNDENYCHVFFKGKTIEGNSAVLFFQDNGNKNVGEISLNAESYCKCAKKDHFVPVLKIPPHSITNITRIDIETISDDSVYNDFILSPFNGDTLVIAPAYPAPENKYLCGFVHSRLQAYKDKGCDFDLAICHNYSSNCRYSFEDVSATRLTFQELRYVLSKKHYKKIVIHFFDANYGRILDTCDLTDTKLYIWAHGVETLYRDSPEFSTPYFKQKNPTTADQNRFFEEHDQLIKKYNSMHNVTWVFVSEWIKKRSEELIGISFSQSVVIPNYINETQFRFEKKDSSLRHKVFFLRRFDNIAKYAIDINVRCILELSRRPCFENMEFNIYGAGGIHSTLVEPLKQFDNVNIYPKFLSHEEIASIHKSNGIGLFATRYDAQGVSMCEAAMSGLAIVSSKNEVCECFLPNDMNLLADTENYLQYADIIESLVKNEDLFLTASKACHDKVSELCNFENTIAKEISLIFDNSNEQESHIDTIENVEASPTLTIVIPAYNAENCLSKCVNSILAQPNAGALEVIVVNDGSKDNTLEVAQGLAGKYNDGFSRQIITIVDKENGGHGSGINCGIDQATGKYFRIVDADDWVESQQLGKLIDILRKEDSDIVLSDHCEDHLSQTTLIPRCLYSFMAPGQPYIFEDLCYPKYGFGKWGPLLATGSFSTQMLKNTDFKLPEKCFYVDMEFDVYSVINAKTVTYYPLNIYRYVIGNSDQSISYDSFIKNYKQHERVIIDMLECLDDHPYLSKEKIHYIHEKLIIPMVAAQYNILAKWMEDKCEFSLFDQKIKKWGNIYNHSKVATRFVRLHRKTKGSLLKINPTLLKVNKAMKTAKKRLK